MTDSKEDGAPKPGSAEAYVQAIMGYTSAFYGAAIAHGMKAGPVADAVAHIERAVIGLAALSVSSPPVGGLARFNPMYNGIEDGFGTVTMVESAAGQWVRYSDVTSPPVGGSGEVVADALARAQETLNNAKVTGENPTSQRALEYRLGELINLLAAPVPNGVPEGAEWRGAGIPFECPYPSVGAVGAPNAYQIDPGAGSAMDRVQRDWPAPSMVENLRLRDGRVTPLYAASPVTPEGLSGGDAK